MTDKKHWILIEAGDTYLTHMMRVDGGHLYRCTEIGGGSVSMVFVPDLPIPVIGEAAEEVVNDNYAQNQH